MTEFYSSEGVSAEYGETSEYSNNHYLDTVAEDLEAYYLTRYAFSWEASASLNSNSASLNGSVGADEINVNVHIGASYAASASSSWNNWSLDLGDGDDGGGIHMSAYGVGAGAVASVSYDSASVFGGAGADTLFIGQSLSALEGAWLIVQNTTRFVDGGGGLDRITAGVTAESGQAGITGGMINWSYNSLHASAGVDGGDILAHNFFSASEGGYVTSTGNNFTLLGGETGRSFINGGTTINAGTADLAGGTVDWSYNSFYAAAGFEGADIYAQNWVNASLGGTAWFTGNSFTLSGSDGADILNSGVGVSAGGSSLGVDGGTVFAWNNVTNADGGSGDDYMQFVLSGTVANGGTASIAGNSYYGTGGDGDDVLGLNWWTSTDGGSAQIMGNTADLSGGEGSDSLSAYLGEGTYGNTVNLFGGNGNDYIETIDWGQNNQRLIAGGAGDDSITDSIGFSTVLFEGAFSDYTIAAEGSGWISVTDNREGSPDGSDKLFQVDQLRFSDGDVLVADLSLPIEGTEGDETLFGSGADDLIYGYGGDDTLEGRAGNDLLDGGSGNDRLFGSDGDDILLGGAGNDQLIGNRGADQLTGGAGADKFIFGALFQSTADNPDLITDFSGATILTTNSQGKTTRAKGEGDKIDLSLLDANANVAGDQAFTLVKHGFSGVAGEVYSSFDAGSGRTNVYLDVDGDAQADMTIQLLGQSNLNGSDFIF